ncbi:YgfZ/GcvT domain-containing protein [Sulfurivermis fontis]|uniref:CAF17-like 4Fe-4S cluster assembly/insertion protein YgfZ n=1 Tax=Sulfurivermis fontis TaxID=1972068 RepID=UPI000FD9302D|nr:folate-binding protein YgfZ [Sulfurivermis fontis]
MLSDWQAFLQQAGASLTAGQVEHFGAPVAERAAALQGDIVVDLSHFGLLRVEGPDALTFMQGQFTNDVRQVNANHSQLSGHLSPKGRLLNVFRLFQRDGAYYLRMPAVLVQPALERLRKYVLMSKVTLSDAGDSLLRIGVSGPHAYARLVQELDHMPQTADEVAHGKGLTVVRVAGPHPRAEVYGEAASIRALWQNLATVAKPAGASAWALLDIHAGLPNIFPANVEAFVPQMVNLQLVNGVSFRKGCYTGQEVVARMQYLGTLKRRMYLAHTDGETVPAPGTELYCSNSESGQGAGRVVDAQPAPGGGVDLLAVVQISLLNDEVRIGDAAGARITFKSPPYAFPAEAQDTGS